MVERESLTMNQLPEWWPQFILDIWKLLTLKPDWNSYGAEKINESCIRIMQQVMSLVVKPDTPQPILTPCSDGSLQLEWNMPGNELEIKINRHFGWSMLWNDIESTHDSDLTVLRLAVHTLS